MEGMVDGTLFRQFPGAAGPRAVRRPRPRAEVDLDPRGLGGRGARGAPAAGRAPAALSGLRLFVSTTTVTGQAVARRGLAVDGVFFAPFDFPGPVRRALDALEPAAAGAGGDRAVAQPHPRGAPARHAGRRGQRAPLAALVPRATGACGACCAACWREVDLFLMQGSRTRSARGRWARPPERVRVSGNLKFDALADAAAVRRTAAPRARGRAGRPLWVAGSTVAGEEALVLEAFARAARARAGRGACCWRRGIPSASPRWRRWSRPPGSAARRRSQPDAAPGRDGDVLLLDTLGELAQVYPLATVVFVGGSLVPAGGHNVLEAAVAGRPSSWARTWRTSRRSPTSSAPRGARAGRVRRGAGRDDGGAVGDAARRRSSGGARARDRRAQPRRRCSAPSTRWRRWSREAPAGWRRWRAGLRRRRARCASALYRRGCLRARAWAAP